MAEHKAGRACHGVALASRGVAAGRGTARGRARVDLAYARHVLEAEAGALRRLIPRVGQEFAHAARMLFRCKGNVITSGIGKAGIIAQKISATLASTGTPSHFLHAAEAVHGDLGRVRPGDVVLILSYGGETAEVTRLLGQLEKMKVPVIAMTGTTDSALARKAKVLLWMGRIDEACPMGLAPSATTTAMLALGDALALTVLKMRQRSGQFSREEFALYHPAGSLGRQLLLVETLMRRGKDLPMARDSLAVGEALAGLRAMRRRSGAVCLVDARGRLTGIFTDADLRRLLEAGRQDALDRPIAEVMTRNPKFVRAGDSAAEAIRIINRYFIEELPVVDSGRRLVGLVDVQDLLATGVGL
ncbi:MAG: KpsF/GutQ family sugar-phosphate isomerase [Planctomycetes bacterium]|nr:KpsF/GutQ family sugar-phosphate isomerase [Planctomycetota bacterium]